MKEHWVDVPEFKDYMVSSFGRIRNWKKGIDLELWFRPSIGFFQVILSNDNEKYPVLLHIIVARSFYNGAWYDELDVEHADGNKTNNHVENLIVVPKPKVIPRNTTSKKLTGVKIVQTGEVFDTQKACAEHIGGFREAINMCLQGKRRSHRGYTFKRVE